MEKQGYQQYLQKVKEQQEERDKLRKVCFNLKVFILNKFFLVFSFLLYQRF